MRAIAHAITFLLVLIGVSHAEVLGEIDSARGFFSIGVMYLDDDAPQIAEQWIEPEITSEIRSDYPNGNANVIIITKIRDDLPQNDSILERVKSKNVPLQKRHGENRVVITEKIDNQSKVLQVTFKEIVYDKYTPYGIGISGSDSIGISQYIVEGGYLVEFFVFLKNNSGVDMDDLRNDLIDLCDEFRNSFKLRKS